MNTRPFQEVAVVGMGLIGGSLGLALRRRGIRVRGIDRDPRALAAARSMGAVSCTSSSVVTGASHAGIIVLCVPITEMRRCGVELAKAIGGDIVVTDAASVKTPVVDAMASVLPFPGFFVGGHPFAGSELKGIAAADERMFAGRTCVLTPTRRTSAAAVRLVAGMWRLCGSRVVRMTPERHDRLAALTSHLPHAIAASLVRLCAREAGARGLAAGSFLDATRVATSPPEMWKGIFMANRAGVREAVGRFSGAMSEFNRLLMKGDGARMKRFLSAAAAERRRLGGRF